MEGIAWVGIQQKGRDEKFESEWVDIEIEISFEGRAGKFVSLRLNCKLVLPKVSAETLYCERIFDNGFKRDEFEWCISLVLFKTGEPFTWVLSQMLEV